jgi:single-strand DNA-binding protein
MPSFNDLTLVGHITKDPVLSYLPSQTPLAEFGIAVNDKYKDKETVMFIDCVCFGKQAETLNKYVKKGDPLLINGKLTLDQWQSQDGQKRSKHKVMVNRFTFLSSNTGQSGSSNTAKPDPPTQGDMGFGPDDEMEF